MERSGVPEGTTARLITLGPGWLCPHSIIWNFYWLQLKSSPQLHYQGEVCWMSASHRSQTYTLAFLEILLTLSKQWNPRMSCPGLLQHFVYQSLSIGSHGLYGQVQTSPDDKYLWFHTSFCSRHLLHLLVPLNLPLNYTELHSYIFYILKMPTG